MTPLSKLYGVSRPPCIGTHALRMEKLTMETYAGRFSCSQVSDCKQINKCDIKILKEWQ